MRWYYTRYDSFPFVTLLFLGSITSPSPFPFSSLHYHHQAKRALLGTQASSQVSNEVLLSFLCTIGMSVDIPKTKSGRPDPLFEYELSTTFEQYLILVSKEVSTPSHPFLAFCHFFLLFVAAKLHRRGCSPILWIIV